MSCKEGTDVEGKEPNRNHHRTGKKEIRNTGEQNRQRKRSKAEGKNLSAKENKDEKEGKSSSYKNPFSMASLETKMVEEGTDVEGKEPNRNNPRTGKKEIRNTGKQNKQRKWSKAEGKNLSTEENKDEKEEKSISYKPPFLVASLKIEMIADLQDVMMLEEFLERILCQVKTSTGVQFRETDIRMSTTAIETALFVERDWEYCSLVEACDVMESFNCLSANITVIKHFSALHLKVKALEEIRNWKTKLANEAKVELRERKSLSKDVVQQRKMMDSPSAQIGVPPSEVFMQLENIALLKNQEKFVFDEVELREQELTEFVKLCDAFSDKINTLDVNCDNFEKCLSKTKRDFGHELASFRQHLPIYAYRSVIRETVSENDVTVLVAETGSGKSTQIAKYLLDESQTGLIACSQPRKMAAANLAEYVSQSLGDEVGGIVGYDFGHRKKVKNNISKVIYTTDYYLLREWAQDETLSKYSCIIVDEAHERSLQTDLLISILRKSLCSNKRENPLKIVITSATIDPSIFCEYYKSFKVKVLNIPGKVFPIETFWDKEPLDISKDYVERAVLKVGEILRKSNEHKGKGNILVFVATPAETERCQTLMEKKNNFNQVNIETLQLHGKLTLEDQRKVFEPSAGIRRVIFSTNAAETSVTVPGVTVVVDTGVAKERQFDPKTNVSVLKLVPINRSSSEQRKGRAGRTSPGQCYRLYSEKDHKEFKADMVPEIKRLPLDQCLLQLFCLGVKNPRDFQFIDPPSNIAVDKSIDSLLYLAAIENDLTSGFHLTQSGKQMGLFSMDPRLSKLLVSIVNSDPRLIAPAIALCAMLSNGGNIFFRQGTDGEKEAADIQKLRFCDDVSDLITMINIYTEWQSMDDQRSKSKWCVDNYINGKSMKAACSSIKEITRIMRSNLNVDPDIEMLFFTDNEKSSLLGLIGECYGLHLAMYSGHPQHGYITLQGDLLKLHPSSSISSLGANLPKYVVYDQVLTTSQSFMLHVSEVEESSPIIQQSRLVYSDEIHAKVVSCVDVRPVGGLVLKKYLMGSRCSLLRKLEDDMKALVAANQIDVMITNFVRVEINVEKGCINIWCHFLYHDMLKHFLEEKVSNIRQELKQETWQARMGSNSLSVILGCGGSVKEPMLAKDYIEIMIKEPFCMETVSTFVEERLSYCRSSYRNKEGNFTISFRVPSQAAQAFETMCDNEVLETELQVKKNQIVKKNALKEVYKKPNMVVMLEMKRRHRTKSGFINFASEIDASAYLHSSGLRMWRPKISKYDPKSIWLCNMNPFQTEEMVMECLPGAANVTSVKLPLEKPFKSSEEVVKYLQNQIRNHLHLFEFSFSQHMRPVEDHFTKWKFFLEFQNIESGYEAFVQLYDSNLCLTDHDLRKFPSSNVSYTINGYVTTITDAYTLLKEDAEKICEGIESHVKAIKTRTTVFLKSDDKDLMSIKLIQLRDLLEGERLEHFNLKYFYSAGNWMKLMEIQSASNVIICRGQSEVKPSITIYGKQQNISDAKIKTNSLLGDIIERNTGHCTIALSGPGIPNGALKSMIKEYKPDLSKLLEKDDIMEAKFILRGRRALVISGHKDTIKQIETDIMVILNSLSNIEKQGEESCSVCFMEPDKDDQYRLEMCGHLICKSCFELQVSTAEVPLICAREDCGLDICTQDFKMFLEDQTENNTVRTKFLKASLDSFMSDPNAKFFFCPTADCGNLFKTKAAMDTTKSTMMTCQDCRSDVCTSCCVVYHVGFSCERYQLIHSTEDGSLWAWIEEDPQNRKLCPNCRVGIEKDGGCFHVTCTKCHSHICWFCMKVFPTGEEVYNHMGTCRI